MSSTTDPEAPTDHPDLVGLPPGERMAWCPDCRSPIESTRGEHPTPPRVPGETTYGYRCPDCGLVFPKQVNGPDAEGLAGMVGRRARFRDGRQRFVPVPEAQLEE